MRPEIHRVLLAMVRRYIRDNCTCKTASADYSSHSADCNFRKTVEALWKEDVNGRPDPTNEATRKTLVDQDI